MVRILVVDDYKNIRQLVRFLLLAKPEWMICGEAGDGQQAIDQCALLSPRLIILDIHMPVMNGFEAARHLRRSHPEILILMLTTDDGAQFALAAQACGADGFLSKANATEHLVTAISALLRGEKYFVKAQANDPDTPQLPIWRVAHS